MINKQSKTKISFKKKTYEFNTCDIVKAIKIETKKIADNIDKKSMSK